MQGTWVLSTWVVSIHVMTYGMPCCLCRVALATSTHSRSAFFSMLLQVGSFEEVLMRMTASEGSELAAWSQVMFVAPGLLQQANQAPGGRLLEPSAAAAPAGAASVKKR